PLEGLSPPELPHKPNGVQGLIGPLTDQMTFDEQFRPAINHVFGDTTLALSQKSAFLASLKGFRTVAVSGDVYEAGGRMETGYYRRPIDLTSFLLSGKAVDQLRSTLISLEGLTKKAKEDVERIERELQELTKISLQTENFIQSTGKEIANSQGYLQRTHKILDDTELRIQQLTREIATEHTILQASSTHSVALRSRLSEHEQNRVILNPAESSALLEREEEHSTIEKELNELVRAKIEVESRLGSLNSTLSMLETSQAQAMEQLHEVQKQLEDLKTNLNSTLGELAESEEALKQLETARNQLSEGLSVVKQKRDQTETQLRDTETEIAKTLDLLDPINTELGTLTATNKNLQMQIEFSVNELKELGFSEVLEVAVDEIQNIQKTLSIIQFMNELDKKKLETFMKAFNQVSKSFNEIFSTVTSGSGRLFLEKPES